MFSSRAAGDGVSFEFKGFEEFEAVLKDLSSRQINNVLRKAFARAQARIEEVLKANAPDAAGPVDDRFQLDLPGSIVSEVKARKGTVEINTGGNYYGRVLEYGWLPSKRPTRRAARVIRLALADPSSFVPPRPWIVPAFEAEKGQLIDEILADLMDEVQKVMRKLAKAQGG